VTEFPRPLKTEFEKPFLEEGWCLRAPLSQPTACRPTPIATTALPFTVRLDTEGTMNVRLLA
jgi:hypothetical protein